MSASKFIPETRDALIDHTAAGLSLPDACRALELRQRTVSGWLTRGRREPEGEYAEFVAAIEAARQFVRDRAEPMSEAELAIVVSELARKGSVQAAKLRWEMLRAEANGEPLAGDPWAALGIRR